MIKFYRDGIRLSFYGVDFVLLAHGEHSMVAKMLYKSSDTVPARCHPNEQSGYVISGQYRLAFKGYDQVIGPGDSYVIPKNAMHSFEIISPGEVIDVFTPPRSDYLEQAAQQADPPEPLTRPGDP